MFRYSVRPSWRPVGPRGLTRRLLSEDMDESARNRSSLDGLVYTMLISGSTASEISNSSTHERPVAKEFQFDASSTHLRRTAAGFLDRVRVWNKVIEASPCHDAELQIYLLISFIFRAKPMPFISDDVHVSGLHLL